MTARTLIAALLVLLTASTTAPAQDHGADHGGDGTAAPGPAGPGLSVGISFATFSPERADILVGDLVTWRNRSVRDHTVTARDESFDSGRLGPGDRFQRRFSDPGTVAYFCRLHPIPGRVDVHRLLLRDPGPAGAPGRERRFEARTVLPQGSEVTLEHDEGAGFVAVARALTDAMGAAVLSLRPRTTASYRLVHAGDVSPARTLVIVDRRVTVRAHPLRGRRTRIEARVTPASPGTDAVLQLRLPHRFGWWPVARARVDRHSRVGFTIPRGRRVPARVVLTLPDGATHLAASRVFHVGSR